MSRLAATHLAAVLLVTVPSAGQEAESDGLGDALSGGDAAVTLRYRYEVVDQEGFDLDANASTLRTTLSYRTRPWKGFTLFLEGENVTDLGTEDRYNNAGRAGLGNGVTDRPVIADPEITEVNQFYLRWRGEATKLDLGRQEILWRNLRFIGNVGWRQNHQSYDAVSLVTSPIEDLELTYLFISNVNRIFGDNQPMSSHLLGGTLTLPLGAVDLYGLYLDYDRSLALSAATWGLAWSGAHQMNDRWKLLWRAEYAAQSDAADNPGRVDADYLHLMLGDVVNGWLTIELGWEVLGGSAEEGQFSTPLATLHKFNGWADKFLTTPTDGLEDLYLSVVGKNGAFAWQVAYHDFSAESSGLDYGAEIDLHLGYTAPWGQGFHLKAAFYGADEFATDTDKVWAYTTFAF